MSVTPFFPPKKSKPIKKENTNPAGLVSTRLMTPLRTTKSLTTTLRRLVSMAADQDRERLEELEGRYVVLAEEHHEEFVFRKAAEAELTAAKAEIARLEIERDLHVLDGITVRAEFVMMRNDKQSAEADAARYKSALTMTKAALLHANTRLTQLEIVGPMLAHITDALSHCEAALQPHKETK